MTPVEEGNRVMLLRLHLVNAVHLTRESSRAAFSREGSRVQRQKTHRCTRDASALKRLSMTPARD